MKPYHQPIDVSVHNAAISNLGNTWAQCWQGLMQGRRPFVDARELFPGWPACPPVSAVTDFARFGHTGVPPLIDRFNLLLGCIAADMRPAVDALFERAPGARVSVLMASSAGDPGFLSSLVDADHDPAAAAARGEGGWADPMLLQRMLGAPWSIPIDQALGRQLPSQALYGACASSLVALTHACDRINAGLCDAVLLIAADTLSRFAAIGFASIGAFAPNGCTPYDRGRSGTTVGEGAVGLLLARKGLLDPTDVAGQVAGTATYCDAAHQVEPNPAGVAKAISGALEQAQVTARDATAVYWHGTGTLQNDKTEARVANLVFGQRSPPCTSTKGSLGHTMGASAGFNVLAALQGFADGWMPHVAGTTSPEFDNLDLALGEPRVIHPGPALVTSLGFGGINAAALLLPGRA